MGKQPHKLTPPLLRAIYKRISEGSTINAACRAVGVTARSLRNLRKSHADIDASVVKAVAKCEVVCAGLIVKAAKGTKAKPGDWKAAAWVLERKYWKNWARRSPEQITPQAMVSIILRIAQETMPFVPVDQQAALRAVFQGILNDPSLFSTKVKRAE